MPNWERPSNDYPSRRDIQEMERENDRREKDYNNQQDKVSAYLKRHPSASQADAMYNTRNN